jgi:hypothetical protein
LQDINFASGVSLSFQENNANTKGVLTVQDGFGDTAKITLMGQYATSNFAKSADTITGTGGTLITMQHIT